MNYPFGFAGGIVLTDEEKRESWKNERENERLQKQISDNRIKTEHEITNRYFIALATLSGASITLLVQHLILDSDTYGTIGLHSLKISMLLFGVALASSVVHNFFRARFDLNDRESKVVDYCSWVAPFAYVIGLMTLIFTVMLSI